MKIAKIAIVAFAMLACLSSGYAQNSQPLEPGYYIVVAAYAPNHENLANRFVQTLHSEGFEATFGLHERTNLLLVYLKYFDNLKGSILEMQQIRRTTRFNDAWVRVVPGDIVAKQNQTAQEPPAAEPADKMVDTVSEEPTELREERIIEPADTIVVTDNEEIVQYKQMTLGNTEVFLSLFHARNNRIVDGEVTVVDTERAKEITRVKGNEYLHLPDPKSESGQLTLICEAFGYRKLQYELNYPVPLADTVKPYIDLMGTTIVVNFDLVRYHKGDIATLYNVYFFNDANVMVPESRYELNMLLQMMQEVPSYRIRLHGHSNGNFRGKIIKMGSEKNFFSLDGSVNTLGTAKELSQLRAEVIRDYLVENGISGDRIEIKAWGGKKPLFDRNGPNARKNVRVEVEILAGQAI
ncbi:MAG TPA: OmpA family protein [Ohtaekwangia sp.]|nr:OmpA family protein [Ohtaekwangia sp.]